MIAPQLPSPEALAPFLEKLHATPGSVIVVAIELPETQNFPRVSIGHFDADARKRLRRALQGEKKRQSKQEERP